MAAKRAARPSSGAASWGVLLACRRRPPTRRRPCPACSASSPPPPRHSVRLPRIGRAGCLPRRGSRRRRPRPTAHPQQTDGRLSRSLREIAHAVPVTDVTQPYGTPLPPSETRARIRPSGDERTSSTQPCASTATGAATSAATSTASASTASAATSNASASTASATTSTASAREVILGGDASGSPILPDRRSYAARTTMGLGATTSCRGACKLTTRPVTTYPTGRSVWVDAEPDARAGDVTAC